MNTSCPHIPGEVPAPKSILINILCESPESTCNKMLSFYILNDVFFRSFQTQRAYQNSIKPSFISLISPLLLCSCSVVSDSAIPWTAARQASLSFTNTQSLLRLMSFESVMPSNYPILCCSLLFLPSIFPSIRVFSKESTLPIR